MMFVMLVAGIGLVLAGLLATGYGISIKEFSTGNTLIITGVMAVCTGAMMLALWMAVRELKTVARRLGTGVPEARGEARGEAMARSLLPVAAARDSVPANGGFPAEQPGGPGPFPATPPPFPPAAPPPWQNESVLRDHPIPEPMHPEPPSSASKSKRNLLFSSTSRKERERAQARSGEPLPPDLLSSDLRPRPPTVPVETAEQPASFDDAWPKAERARPGEISPQWRSGRMPPTLAEANGGPARPEGQPDVTVLKSGVVDGMAYSLYSDGSIEAQMPEGMMRFASIDELRAHLDQRS
jgi:hypothetical protein